MSLLFSSSSIGIYLGGYIAEYATTDNLERLGTFSLVLVCTFWFFFALLVSDLLKYLLRKYKLPSYLIALLVGAVLGATIRNNLLGWPLSVVEVKIYHWVSLLSLYLLIYFSLFEGGDRIPKNMLGHTVQMGVISLFVAVSINFFFLDNIYFSREWSWETKLVLSCATGMGNVVMVGLIFSGPSRTGSQLVAEAVFSAVVSAMAGLLIMGFIQPSEDALVSGKAWRFLGAVGYVAVTWTFGRRITSFLLRVFWAQKVETGLQFLRFFLAAIVLLGVFLVGADAIGIGFLAGAFFAGAIFRLAQPLSDAAVRGRFQNLSSRWLVPIFFITHGMLTDYVVSVNLILLVFFSVIAWVSRQLAIFVALVASGYKKKRFTLPDGYDAQLYAVAYMAQALLVVAVCTEGVSRGFLPRETIGSATLAFAFCSLFSALGKMLLNDRKKARRLVRGVLAKLKIEQNVKLIENVRSPHDVVAAMLRFLWEKRYLHDRFADPNTGEALDSGTVVDSLAKRLKQRFSEQKIESIEGIAVVPVRALKKKSKPVAMAFFIPKGVAARGIKRDRKPFRMIILVLYPVSDSRALFALMEDRLVGIFRRKNCPELLRNIHSGVDGERGHSMVAEAMKGCLELLFPKRKSKRKKEESTMFVGEEFNPPST